MAKETNKPTTVSVELKDAVSANWTAVPTDDAPEGAEKLGGAIWKGERSDNGKVGYQVVMNGVAGEVRPNFKSAIVAGLSKLANVVPANYTYAEKWTDVHKPNKEPEVEKISDLSKEEQKLFNDGYKAIHKAQEAEIKAEGSRLAAACTLADAVYDVRIGLNSTQWGLFRKLAPEDGTKQFLGKNTVGEAFKASAIRRVEGFDMSACLPERVSGNKGIVSAYQSAINAVAGNVAACVRSNKAAEMLDFGDVGTSEQVRKVLNYFVDEGVYSLTEAGNQTDLEGSMAAMAGLMVPLHLDNIPEETGLFDFENDKYRVAKVDKKPVAGTLFGLEGDDELLSAIARKLSESIVKDATAGIADATSAMVKEARNTKLPFEKWNSDRAARHLAHILFSRWPEDGSTEEQEAAQADINGILELIGGWADQIFEGNLEVSDILNPGGEEAPENEEAGTDDADADMSE